MSTDLVIANPESAGRVFEAGEDVRAFLVTSRAGKSAIQPPFLIWVTVEPRVSFDRKCGCRQVVRMTDFSLKEMQSAFTAFESTRMSDQNRYLCACSGSFID